VSTALQLYDDLDQRLASIETVDEAKAVRDQAEALRLYVKQRHRGLEAQNHCAFIKILAECRAGVLLLGMERAQGDRHGNGLRSTMERSGIAPVTGHRWQIMAMVPEAAVRQLWTTANAQGTELTSAAIYRVGKALHRGRARMWTGTCGRVPRRSTSACSGLSHAASSRNDTTCFSYCLSISFTSYGTNSCSCVIGKWRGSQR
jgi:hypothetical protein